MVQIKNGSGHQYLCIQEGWLYLTIVLDPYSGRTVGRTTSDQLMKHPAITALKRAIAKRQLTLISLVGLIHHSDLGSQYYCHGHRKLLDGHGMHSSTNGREN